MARYFEQISEGVKSCYKIADQARKKNLDPEDSVPIPLARNMAERVVGLVSVVAPQIQGSKVTPRISELEKKYGQLDWRVGLVIAEEVAREKFFQCKDRQEAIETGIRVGFAYLTLGIVSAPLEGFIGLKIKKRRDGKEYFALQYAGPIRGAGGTAAATSVIISDYVRVQLGYSSYDPEEAEINRFAAEIRDYHERVTNLQYFPSEKEIKFMVSRLPVEVDGDPTEKIEVSNYKDLPRISTNMIRGGMALVLAEGLCQKAPKLWKRISKWGEEFGLSWGFLGEFLKLKDEIHAAHAAQEKTKEEKVVKANNTFIMDLVAGRPILTYPLAEGGFRLRYGRGRTTGFSATALHPATLIVLDKYIAIGTQLKMERPGKAATVTLCETLEGPIVRLKDGSVLQLESEQSAKQHNSEVEEIIFLGDILFNYGDFSENGQNLVPAGYCEEWWSLEVERSLKNLYQDGIWEKAGQKLKMEPERVSELVNNCFFSLPSWEEAVQISSKLEVPLHPHYTFYWKLVSGKDLLLLKQWLQEGSVKTDEQGIKKIVLPFFSGNELHGRAKNVLDHLGAAHSIINKENLVLARKEAAIFAFCFNFSDQEGLKQVKLDLSSVGDKNGLEVINFLSPIRIGDKAGTFIGSRMGRPEKAKMRSLTGSPQVMFPVGEEGDRLRSFQAALEAGKVKSTFPLYLCTKCSKENIYRSCEECGGLCEKKYFCRECGVLGKDSCRHGSAKPYREMELDIKYYFNKSLERLQEKVFPDLIKGIRGTSNKEHVVEHLAKGVLRAKHNLYVNKDGTTRYDCTELPLTHFKPKEIKTSWEKLRELGYEKDITGAELASDNQILELKPQDIVLPGFGSLDESAPQVLFRVANFIDDLLVRFYRQKPFYNLTKEEEIIGHLVIGLAPHISAGLVGRIIGFSETQGLLAHPMWHAGLRRDCDGDEAAVMLLLDGLLNFSRHFLPNTRGSTMDSPLVLTSVIDASEVDDQVHGIDVAWKYPIELYEAALEMKKPWEVKVEQLAHRLGTPLQYEQYGFTHHVDNFNRGVQCSAYKTLPSMEEKLFGQMEIAKKVRAVDLDDVARLVIQKHFLKDTKGNLRKFSMQQFRCVGCNSKFRRPPLTSKCSSCGGKLIFTISEGSVTKYLGPSLLLAEKYAFSPYLKQTLDILKTGVDHIFGKEKEKQVGLVAFMER